MNKKCAMYLLDHLFPMEILVRYYVKVYIQCLARAFISFVEKNKIRHTRASLSALLGLHHVALQCWKVKKH